MGISIGSNFDLGAALPMDSRYVRAQNSDLASIPNKYNGLEVFTYNDNKKYRYQSDSWVEILSTMPQSGILDWQTNKYAPYAEQSDGKFDSGVVNPTHTTRLNYDGYLYATKLYSGGTEVSVTTHAHGSITSEGYFTSGGTLNFNSTDTKSATLFGDATASTYTKTVNLGTGGVSGSTTNINIGSSYGGTLSLKSMYTSILSAGGTSPGLTTALVTGEIWGGSGSSDTGFLRLSAGGATTLARKTAIDIQGYCSTASDSSFLRFFTGGAARVFIDAFGYVTINNGSTSLNYNLGVNGNIYGLNYHGTSFSFNNIACFLSDSVNQNEVGFYGEQGEKIACMDIQTPIYYYGDGAISVSQDRAYIPYATIYSCYVAKDNTNNVLTVRSLATTPANDYQYTIAIGRYTNSTIDLTIGSDASYVYMQSWNSLPILINSQGNAFIDGQYSALSSNTWDTKTGLKKTKGSISSSFTLTISNLVNGMQGDLRLAITSTSTITLSISGATIKGNGSLTSLVAGIYHFCFTYDGTNFDWNIARYS